MSCDHKLSGYDNGQGIIVNLQEFLNYRQNCPVCGNNLFTEFHSNRKQVIKHEDGRLTFTVALEALNKHQTAYKASYSFSLLDQSFQVEFFTKEGLHYYKEAPKFLLQRFMGLHQNLEKTRFRFIRECSAVSCMRYVYYSNFFNIDLKRARFDPLVVQIEGIGLVHTLSEQEDQHRIFRLINHLPEKKSSLFFWKGVPEESCIYWAIPSKGVTNLELPLIPFISQEKTVDRLNNLIVFS